MVPNSPVTKGTVEHLAGEVSGLRKAYERYRLFLIVVLALSLAQVAVIIWLFAVAGNAQDAADEAKAAQIAACQNANDTRANQSLVWDFVLDLSAADAGPAEKAALETIRTWIHDVFAARDCSDLTKLYETPVPPDVKKLLQAIKEAGEG